MFTLNSALLPLGLFTISEYCRICFHDGDNVIWNNLKGKTVTARPDIRLFKDGVRSEYDHNSMLVSVVQVSSNYSHHKVGFIDLNKYAISQHSSYPFSRLHSHALYQGFSAMTNSAP